VRAGAAADGDPHPRPMAAAPTPLPPGSMTVPPLFGWETVAVAVTLLLAAGMVFLLVTATRAGAGRRDEWRALLEARSARGGDGRPDDQVGARQPGATPSR
jgi:hypothetical protein